MEQVLGHALSRLGEEMRVSTSEARLTCVLSSRGFQAGNIIGLSKTNLKDPHDRIIGHEVAHFLHSQCRPRISRLYHQNMEAANLCELVAVYAQETYARLDRSKVRKAKKAVQKIITELRVEDFISPAVKLSDQQNYEIHEGGCRAGQFLHAKFRSKHLHEFAHTGIRSAKSKLKELGYKGELYTKYKPADEYEFIDDKGNQAIMCRIDNLNINELIKIIEHDSGHYRDSFDEIPEKIFLY